MRDMASLSMRALSVRSSSSKQHRKYLGDPSDLHYVPKSPLIERRKFSAQDEEQLKHLCSLALADIPHSDDMMDDPFRYLGGYIAAKTSARPSVARPQTTSKQQINPQRANIPEHSSSSGEITATPSDTSKRDTVQTTLTTPITTPGVRPGDTDRRLSESGKRSQNSSSSAIKTVKGQGAFSFLNEPLPVARPQLTATKSLTHLPSLTRSKSKQKMSDVSTQSSTSIGSQPDFNKSLPAIPRFPPKESDHIAEVTSTARAKSGGISRMFKTAHLKRSQTAHELPLRGTSSEQAPTLGQLNKMVSLSSSKKSKFSFSSIFHKRPAVNNKRATLV